MKITTISYGKTFNLKNYESQRIDMTAQLDEGEDEQIAVLQLKAAVLGIGGDSEGASRVRQALQLLTSEAIPHHED
jgi:hypothetical protein